MFGLGLPELLVILAVLLLLFGAKRLPGLARSLSKSVNEFKDASKEMASQETGSQETASQETGRENNGEKENSVSPEDKKTI